VTKRRPMMALVKEEDIERQLSAAIRAYNNNRAQILLKAFDEGGQPLVQQLEAEYDALRDAYFTLLKKQLDQNNHRYEELTIDLRKEAERLEKDIDRLESTASIMNTIASVINLVGRVLIVLGV
jgi:hypothetical protein